MKSVISAIILAGASLVAAQGLNQSLPFNLQIHTCDNSTLNGKYFTPCHEGAAIEGLCPVTVPLPKNESFYFNYTAGINSPTGYLTWVLPANGGSLLFSEVMSLSTNPTTNVAVPLLQPSQNGQPVGFDKDDFLFIQGLDDSVAPLNMTNVVQFQRWAVCTTYVGYKYDTLAWTLGAGEPENPTCHKVKVKRVFF
jgi:hypothetical protein